MAKIWEGRTKGALNKEAEEFNASISFDYVLMPYDITGSMAHADMLAKQKIITQKEKEAIKDGLAGIQQDILSEKLKINFESEDVHSFIEEELTKRIGEAGKKLHTARSRNDQVALDIRLYVQKHIHMISDALIDLIKTISTLAKNNLDAIMPGYTHMQHAQPILFSHHILAYASMFLRDASRLTDALSRTDVSPIGSCALAGTTYNTDREYEALQLGFSHPCINSIDGVSDRDFCVEFLSDLSIIMMHLSRFSEEIILWNTSEFGFIEISDEYSTGSSIMPQKKNPDIAELCRGKTGRVYGNLFSLLTTLKGLPLAYNKDMQEDKEPVFDSLDTVYNCLIVFTGMLATIKINKDKMYSASQTGFMNATDLADYLVKQGIPFRDAYKISGKIVSYCIQEDKILEEMSLEEFKIFSPVITENVYEAIKIENCVNRRTSFGGTGKKAVLEQLKQLDTNIELLKNNNTDPE